MRLVLIPFCFALLSVSVPCAALAVVTATANVAGPVTRVTRSPDGVRWRVELDVLTAVSQDVTFNVRGDAADIIEYCFVNSTTPFFVNVSIRGTSPGTPIASIGRFSIGNSSGIVRLSELRVSGNCGEIQTNAINLLDVGGNVTGNIEIWDNPTYVYQERVDSVFVAGNMNVSLTADTGYIGSVVVSGTLGAPPFTRTIRAFDRIENVRAASILANISATGTTAGSGLIRRVETTGGSFNGSLTAREITGAFGTGTPGIAIVGGTLNAPVTVGRGLPAGASITVPANGLTKQVVINNLNDPSNLWAGSVTVAGQAPLTGPNYPVANATLGNGSIGRVPFDVHDASSSPTNNLSEAPNNNSITNTDMMGLTQTPARSIVLEFDGPIEFADSAPPVKVTLLGTECSNPPDFSSSFVYTIDTTATGRRLTLTRDANAPFPKNVIVPGNYKVERLASGGLRCKDVPGTPAVAAFDYRFRVYSDCNGDGTPFNGGILEDNCGANGACDPIDFNRDGVYPSEQDTIDFDSVLGGGPCSTGNCGDIDFNNDGVFPSQDDVIAWYGVLAGDCVQCWP